MGKGGLITSNVGYSNGKRIWKIKCVKDDASEYTRRCGIGDKEGGYFYHGHAGKRWRFPEVREREEVSFYWI